MRRFVAMDPSVLRGGMILAQRLIRFVHVLGMSAHGVVQQEKPCVNLRFFAGLSLNETALAIGLSLAQTKREWALAKAWLLRELQTTENLT